MRPDRDFENLFDATWLPGGQRIAFTDGCDWWSMKADGSDVRLLPGVGPTFSAAGTRLAWVRGWETYRLNEEGLFERVGFSTREPIQRNGERFSRAVGGFAILRRGKVQRTVFYQGGFLRASSCLATARAAGTSGDTLSTPETEERPRLSPDGLFVAYTDTIGNPASIYTISMRGGPPRRLTRSARDDVAPVWSPDSRKIAFVRQARDFSNQAVYVMNADGSGQHLVARNAGGVAWSPDGHELVIDGNPKGEGAHLYVIDTGGNIVRRLNAQSGLGLTWAPADTIAYVYDRGDQSQEKCGD